MNHKIFCHCVDFAFNNENGDINEDATVFNESRDDIDDENMNNNHHGRYKRLSIFFSEMYSFETFRT